MPRYFIESVQSTNEIIKQNTKAKILIISLGHARTELHSQRENIIEIDMMMEDTNKIGILFEYKIMLIKHLLENSKQFDMVIVRCDAGASRSQAIGTLFHKHFGIKFENNIHIGNYAILIEGDKILKTDKYSKDEIMNKVFIKPFTWYWNGRSWKWNGDK